MVGAAVFIAVKPLSLSLYLESRKDPDRFVFPRAVAKRNALPNGSRLASRARVATRLARVIAVVTQPAE